MSLLAIAICIGVCWLAICLQVLACAIAAGRADRRLLATRRRLL
jgi:hypothetical protein